MGHYIHKHAHSVSLLLSSQVNLPPFWLQALVKVLYDQANHRSCCTSGLHPSLVRGRMRHHQPEFNLSATTTTTTIKPSRVMTSCATALFVSSCFPITIRRDDEGQTGSTKASEG